MNRLRFLAGRLAQTLVVLVAVAFLTFAVFSLWPSDPAALACGKPCTPDNLARAQAFMGYDQPWYTQFWDYLTGIVAGRTFGQGAGAIVCAAPCLGYSFRLSTPVTTLIASRLPVTVSLALGAAALWLVIGVVAGVTSALRRVIGRHVMRNVSLPVLTYFALDLGGMLGGAVITERVFSMQGLGALLMDAVGTVDVPVVMGVTLVAAGFVVLANLLVDACAALIDPCV